MVHRVLFLFSCLIAINTTVFGVETILFIRHGEKPINGLGQLSCRGMNRSLSLPNVILTKFGTPDFLVAPNPVIQKEDKGISYNYLRPLVTLEPLAIKTSKNINLTCGYNEIDCVSALLLTKEYDNKTVLIAWEHHNIEDIIKKISDIKSNNLRIPNWENDDFDTIYVLTIDKNFMNLRLDKQGLNNQSENCSF